MACVVIQSSVVRVHDSQAYRKMDVTREHMSHILKLREILSSFQTGFNLVNGAVVCAVLESNSGLETSSVITEPSTWNLWLSQASVHLLQSLCWCHRCCLSSAWSSQHWPPCCRLWRHCQDTHLILPVLLPLLVSHRCHQQSEDGNCSASYADSAFMIFQGVFHDPFKKYIEEGGWE